MRQLAGLPGFGEAIKALHVPIGSVLSSPAYRALETAHLASLGEPTSVAELYTDEHSMSQAAVDAARITWLRQSVARAPTAGRIRSL
jgi:phosphohistidine phosphatase SixA